MRKTGAFIFFVLFFSCTNPVQAQNLFNVKNYGASGIRSENAQPSIQQAIDACAEAGGGTVYFPPGEYTAGTLQLRSNLTLHLEAGATLFASRNAGAYTVKKSSGYQETGMPMLLYGRDLHHLTISGKGTIDGQAEHRWEDLTAVDDFMAAETENARRAGVEMKRAYALDPKVSLLYLVNCTDVRIEDISFLHSPHWTLHLAHNERV
jgi:polygalacturonase